MNDKKQVRTRSGRAATRISLTDSPNNEVLPLRHKKNSKIAANQAKNNIANKRTAPKQNSNSADAESNAKGSTRHVTSRRGRFVEKQSSNNVDVFIARKSTRNLKYTSEKQSEKEKSVDSVSTRRAKASQTLNSIDVNDNSIARKSTRHSVNTSVQQSEEAYGTVQYKSKNDMTQVAAESANLKQETERKEKSQNLNNKVSSKTEVNKKSPIKTINSSRDVQIQIQRRSNRFSIVSFKEFNIGGSSTPLKDSGIQLNKEMLKSPKSVGHQIKITRSPQKAKELDDFTTTNTKGTTLQKINTRTSREGISDNSNVKKNKTNGNLDELATFKQKILKKNVALPIYKKTIRSPKKSAKIQFKKALRTRRPNLKYADFEDSELIIKDDDDDDSGEDEDKELSDNKNVPIYKKVLQETTKKTKDVYDFEGDSAENSLSDSDNEYDKEMIAEMKEIKKIERKQTTKAIKTLIATKSKAKSKPKLLPVRRMIKDDKVKKINVLENIEVVVAPKLGNKATIKKANETEIGQAASASVVDNSLIAHEISADFNHMQKDASVVLPPPGYSNAAVRKQNNLGRNIASQILESFLEPDHNTFNPSPLQTTFIKPALIQEKINIRRSGVNSPLLGQASPTRSNLVLRNGPYVLQTKRDSLPSFNQDIVLNSTMVESRGPAFRCRISAIAPRDDQNENDTNVTKTSDVSTALKRTKQTSILQFIPGKSVAEPDLHCTLFDANLLSPVKFSTPMGNNVSQDKRRVLRDLTNLHSSIVNTPERGESDVEFFALSAGVEAVARGKPTRFVLNAPRNVEKPPAKDDCVVENVMHNSSVFNSPEPDARDEDTNHVVGIFQDFNELNATRLEPPSFTYERKKRRYRRVSHASEHEDENLDDETKTKRRKKGEMTKKEKQEFDAWSTTFNKLCDEIEQFPLEVE